MKIQCPSCDQRLEIPEELAGQTIECPACNASLAVPSLATAPPSPVQVQQSAPQPTSSEKSKSPIVKWAIASVASITVLVGLSIIFFSDASVKSGGVSPTAKEADYSGKYTLYIYHPEGDAELNFELKPDGSFFGRQSNGDQDDVLIGSWKVKGELLVSESKSTKSSNVIIVKFNKKTGKLESLNRDGNELPIKDLITEGEDGLYFKKN